MLNAKYSSVLLKQPRQMLNAHHRSSSTELLIQIINKILCHFALKVLITVNDEVTQQQTQPKVFSRILFPEPLRLGRPKLRALGNEKQVTALNSRGNTPVQLSRQGDSWKWHLVEIEDTAFVRHQHLSENIKF